MGCICSKGGFAVDDHLGENESKKSTKKFVASSRRDEVIVEVDNGGNEATARLISTEVTLENVSTPTVWNEGDRKKALVVDNPHLQKRATMDAGVSGGPHQISRVFSTSNGVDGAQVSAGWPSWLTAVAGEAIKGWVPRKANSFEKLDKIGQGTYSSVYRARDLETGKIVALKKVRFVNMDPESVRFMAREILILRRLDHPNVMRLEGLVTSRGSGNLYLVFEYMEHDLAGLVASPNVRFTEPQIKCYMHQLFSGLEHCHSRGVLHRDIKGSNLLIDINGNLKIGDFGLSTFYRPDPKQPLTSRVVTLWYRPPELLLGATDYGVAVDLWSAGCILAELYAGKPIMPGRTEVEQLHKIFRLCGSPSDEYWQKSKLPHATIFKPQHPYNRCVSETFKDFSPPVLAFLDVLLAVEPEHRGSASSALQSEFFTTKPFPCDPSNLPIYPPSKELDAKIRDEEARRKREADSRGHANDSSRKGSRESKAVPTPDANAELQPSVAKRQGQSNPKSNSREDGPSRSGHLVKPGASGSSMNEREASIDSQQTFASKNKTALGHLSRFSNSVAVHGSSRYDMSRETIGNPHWPEERLNDRYNEGSSSVNHDWSSHHLLEVPKSCKKDEPAPGKESTMVYAPKKNRIHYSGPLLPSGRNIEEMLKEHEKQIQHAVRKARLDKTKSKKIYGDNGLTESLLHYEGNVR